MRLKSVLCVGDAQCVHNMYSDCLCALKRSDVRDSTPHRGTASPPSNQSWSLKGVHSCHSPLKQVGLPQMCTTIESDRVEADLHPSKHMHPRTDRAYGLCSSRLRHTGHLAVESVLQKRSYRVDNCSPRNVRLSLHLTSQGHSVHEHLFALCDANIRTGCQRACQVKAQVAQCSSKEDSQPPDPSHSASRS